MRTYPIVLLVVGLLLSACEDPGSPTTTNGPSTGSLLVSTSTAGDDPDQDGYLLTVDNVDSLELDPNATVKVDLAAGRHTLRLFGVAEHCSVAPATSVEVSVRWQRTTPVAFGVSCPATGARVSVKTTGLDIDPDGYRVLLDGSDRGAISSNGTVLIRIESGSRTIALAGLAPNCAVSAPGLRMVTIVAAAVAPIEFAVVCAETTHASRTLAFESNGDIYRADIDGWNLRRLTFDGSPYSYNREAAWSPDGRRIAFSKSDGYHGAAIYVIDADGTNLTRLSPEGAYDASPTWSPDGRRIAFESMRDSTGYGGVNSWLDPEIYVMNADGTNQVRLTKHLGHNDYTPAWSPDGSRIAYVSDTVGHSYIYVINADGTNPVQLTSGEHEDYDPAWSPDGRRIAFSGSSNLFVVDADGANLTPLAPASIIGGQPAWSPDGLLIAFTRATDCHVDSYGDSSCRASIWLRRANGSMYELPLRAGSPRGPVLRASGPSWRP